MPNVLRPLVFVTLSLTLTEVPTMAMADCICECVNGSVQALCSSSMDLQPICAPEICPIVPPAIQPIQPPTLPPLGTSSCAPEQVLNPATGQYEWQSVCQ